jgi:hypothetical protein
MEEYYCRRGAFSHATWSDYCRRGFLEIAMSLPLYHPGWVDCFILLSAAGGCAQAARAFTSLFMKKEK